MPRFWAGSEESYEKVLEADRKVQAMLAQPGMTAGVMDSMMSKMPSLWRHEGDKAVIEIDGALVDGSAGWMRMFGVIGYDEISAAATEAATDPDTRALLFHINSPGGDVAGVMECGALLNQISGLKPSAVHTTNLLASAGYWLATSIQGQLTVGETSVVGSIGVLRVHAERSKALEEDGIKVTVIRSGQYKAETNPYEELSPEAKARVESQLADVHALFRAQVAKGRPNLEASELMEVTQGQTFLGKRAVKAGLADQAGSFTLALKLLDKRKQPGNTFPNSKGKAMKIVLSEDQITAISAGATLESLGFTAEQIAAHQAAEKAEADQAAADAAAQKADKEAADAKAIADAAAAAGNPAQAPPANDAVVALLNTQLAAAQASLVTVQAELLNVKAAAATATAAHDGLMAIARKATANMLLPLGASAAAVDGLDAVALIAEHSRVTALFQTKFKPGQQTVSTPVEEKPQAAELPKGFLAAVKNAPSAKAN